MPPKLPKFKVSVAKPQAQAPPAAPRRSTSRTRTVLTPGSAVTAPAPVRTPTPTPPAPVRTPTPTPPASSSTATVLLFSDQDAPFATPAAPSAVAVPVTPGLLSTTPPASSSTVFSEAVAAVKKARKTASRKVGHGINLKKLQKALHPANKPVCMYGTMLSSVLLHQKQVVTVLRFLHRDYLADFIIENSDLAKEILGFIKRLDKTGSVAGGELEDIQKHLTLEDDDSPLVAALKLRLDEERELCSILVQVKKCKDLVKFLRSATYSAQLSTMVLQECDTRWNSVCIMLNSLVKAWDEVKELLTANGEAERLNGIVFEDMQWLNNFLSVFKDETDLLQGQNYPTLPYALLATIDLQEHCDPVLLDSPAQAVLRQRASAGVTKKLKITMDQKIATFLWPKYRHLPMLSEKDRKEVYDKVRELLSAAQTTDPDADVAAQPAPSPPKKPRLDNRFDKWCSTGRENGLGELDEVDRYLLSGSSTVQVEGLLGYWQSEQSLEISENEGAVILTIFISCFAGDLLVMRQVVKAALN
ncbi:Transposable element Hobo transposase [Frankliniella fusca]|uniref:Transposable element Hobo transposase n=1 Tax=Frankliniella fusca TaxID=407009 RepID=A0AAE1GQQ0_9NEOP|nr:Transposable element Hobo transposase [Frankliniella fusca]